MTLIRIFFYSVVFLLTATSAHSQEEAVKRAILDSDKELQNVEVHVSPANSSLFVAICENEPGWWGKLRVVSWENHKINWSAELSEAPTGNTIARTQWVQLQGFPQPLVEIFDETHQGNGYFYLYALNGKQLTLLLKTFALDEHTDSSITRGRMLKPEYRDLDGDGFSDVKLSGTIDYLNDKEQVTSSVPCTKVFLWEKKKGNFVEDAGRRDCPKADDES